MTSIIKEVLSENEDYGKSDFGKGVKYNIEYVSTEFVASQNNKSKINFYASIISVASRTIILIILSNFKLGIYSFIISLSINIILTTLYSYIKLNKYLK